MKKYILYIAVFIVMGSFSSCSKFLDVKPKGLIIPETMEDYEDILNSPTLTRSFPEDLLYMTDDYYKTYDLTKQSAAANIYYWVSNYTVDENVSPKIWGPLYSRIYYSNVITNNIMESTDGSLEKKKAIYGEALFHRSIAYLDLLTVFAKAYDNKTAATDWGIPIVSTTDITETAPPRATVEENFKKIIDDVTLAAEYLPESNFSKYRINKYAAYALLSRIFLYMGDMEQAMTYTDLALNSPHKILNYNDYEDADEVPQYSENPEVLFHRDGIDGGIDFDIYTEDLKSFFSESDLRYSFLTVTNNSGIGRSSFDGDYSFGLNFPELYLTKAELLARKGKGQEALAIINSLRQNRIVSDDYEDIVLTDNTEIFKEVLSERRREMAFSGMRWFDMKRLDREGLMVEVKRTDLETGTVRAVLSPKSELYVYEIPARVLKFNPSMPLNHPKN